MEKRSKKVKTTRIKQYLKENHLVLKLNFTKNKKIKSHIILVLM
jgi:hypothetical protein